MDTTTALLVVAYTMAVLGTLGSFLPVLPGVPLLFAGLVLAAWAEDFVYVGAWHLAGLGALGVLAQVVDFVAGSFGTRRYGASKRAAVGAAIGALVGLFFGLPGILLGPLIGAILGELSARRSLHGAGRAGLGAAIGMALGAAAKLAISFTMLFIFLLLRFF